MFQMGDTGPRRGSDSLQQWLGREYRFVGLSPEAGVSGNLGSVSWSTVQVGLVLHSPVQRRGWLLKRSLAAHQAVDLQWARGS